MTIFFLETNLDNLTKHIEEKTVSPSDGYITEENNANINLNISRGDFDLEFPSAQKIMLTPFSHSVFPSQTDIFTPSPTQRQLLASYSLNIAPPSA